jgi:adenylate cyclase
VYDLRVKPSETWGRLAEALLGAPAFTVAEVAQEAGVDRARAERLWRALGFPPVDDHERVFTRSDVEVLRAAHALVAVQGTDPVELIQLTRVIGQSLARVADAQVTASAERLARLRSTPASSDVTVAGLVDRIEALAPSLEQFLGYVWRRHLVAALRRLSAQPSAADRTLTVGFADLVGFTAMSQALDAGELAAMVDRFEAVAYEHIPARGGRIVKMIGDEVMFAVDEGPFAADIGIALVEAHARDATLPECRVGLATGPTLAWEGDLFGPTVNLASRLVNLARPGSVLLSDDLGEGLQDDPRFELRHLRPVGLHGIGRVRPWVLRRAHV